MLRPSDADGQKHFGILPQFLRERWQDPGFRKLLVILGIAWVIAALGTAYSLWVYPTLSETAQNGIKVYCYYALISGLLLVSIFSCKFSSRINMPYLLLFLGVGLLAGSEWFIDVPLMGPGIKGGHTASYVVANYIGALAMAFILFSGGFDTDWKATKRVFVTGGILSSLGVLLTALFNGSFIWLLCRVLNFSDGSFAWCLLLGAIISSTDAAAVFSILRSRSVSLKGDLQPLLEFESGSNDPMATFLTLFMIGIVQLQQRTGTAASWDAYLMIVPWFCWKMAAGIAIGWGIGRFAVWLYNWIDLDYAGLYYAIAVLTVLAAFSLPELVEANGFMGVYVAGLVMGNRRFVFHNGVGRFSDGISWLMQILLFTMLGVLASPEALWKARWQGLAVAAFLMLAARPLATFLCMAGSRFTTSEKVFVSWVGLRGGAPIMLATFPLMAVTANGRMLPSADVIFYVVFFTVLTSVLFQGMTIMPLARLLNLDAPLKKIPRVPLTLEETGDDSMVTREIEVMGEAAGSKLSEFRMPDGSLILMICRGEKVLVPRGDTRLQEGDVVTVMGTAEAMRECRSRFTRN